MNWYVFRVVLARVATLTEIRSQWNICDLADMNEALDVKAELEAEQAKKAKRGQ